MKYILVITSLLLFIRTRAQIKDTTQARSILTGAWEFHNKEIDKVHRWQFYLYPGGTCLWRYVFPYNPFNSNMNCVPSDTVHIEKMTYKVLSFYKKKQRIRILTSSIESAEKNPCTTISEELPCNGVLEFKFITRDSIQLLNTNGKFDLIFRRKKDQVKMEAK